MSSISPNYHQPVVPIFDSSKTQEEKNNMLFRAIEEKNVSKVRALLSQGADLKAKDSRSGNALRAAVRVGSLKIVKLLVEVGMDVNTDCRGVNALFFVKDQDVDLARFLILKGININQKNPRGDTSLHHAVLGMGEIVKLLIANNAEIDVRNQKGETPLENAFHGKQFSIAKLLIDAGADVQDRALLLSSIERGELDAVEFLFEMGVDLDKAFDGAGKTPLLFALERNQTKIAKYLIEKGASLSVQDKDGKTPLHYAIEKNNDEIIELLIKKALQANTLSDLYIEDNEKKTALFYAIERGDISTLRSLIEGAEENNTPLDLNASDKNGRSLLFYAVLFNSEEIIRFLMDKGVKVEASSRFLHLAVEKNNTEIVKLLLKNGVASQMTKEKLTKLLFAAAMIHCNKEIQILLIEAGADVNKENRSLLSYLRDEDVTDLGKLLIEKGAHVNVKESRDNKAPLHSAIEKGRIETVRFLIANGADLNIKDRHGKPPLYTAMQERNYQIAELLVEGGADVHARDYYSKNWMFEISLLECAIMDRGTNELTKALIQKNVEVSFGERFYLSEEHLYFPSAIQNGNVAAVRHLIAKGAKITNQRGRYDISVPVKTLLHSAAEKGNTEIVELLIDRATELDILKDFYVQDEFNKTPLYYAVENGNVEVAELLVKRGCNLISSSTSDDAFLGPILVCLAHNEKQAVRDLLLERTLKDIGNGTLSRSMECVKEVETLYLRKKIDRNEYGDLRSLLSDRQKFSRVTKNPKASEEDKIEADTRLREMAKDIKAGLSKVRKARMLLNEGKILKAKEKLQLSSEKSAANAGMCSYLIGMMTSENVSLSDVKPVIKDLLAKINFKSKDKYESVFSTLLALLENSILSGDEKIKILKKITETASKSELLKSLGRVRVLSRLEAIDQLKTFLHPEKTLEHLSDVLGQFFESQFCLDIKDIGGKYERTFGDIKKFRNPDAIFSYLVSLKSGNNLEEIDLSLDAYSKYIGDVLEGRFIDERYNLENNPHLQIVFGGDTGSELLDKWKVSEALPLEMLVPMLAQLSTFSGIDYLKTFQQKIVMDNHLGVDWKEIYPHLARVLNGEQDVKDGLAALDGEPSVLETEAQRLLLVLSQNSDLSKEAQVELLKKASQVFTGTVFQNDLDGLVRGLLSADKKNLDFSKYTICDTDDPCDILLMGTEIQGSCQSVDACGDFNRGLLGPLLDGKYRIIAVKDEYGRMVARCLLKILWDEKKGVPVLFQERHYVGNQPQNAEYHSQLLDAMCTRKAEAMNLPLLKLKDSSVLSQNSGPVVSLGGRSPFEYVDAARGSEGNTYKIPNWTVIWQPK